eukprot:1408925-Alexandrium_andersonii.AAC.1
MLAHGLGKSVPAPFPSNVLNLSFSTSVSTKRADPRPNGQRSRGHRTLSSSSGRTSVGATSVPNAWRRVQDCLELPRQCLDV